MSNRKTIIILLVCLSSILTLANDIEFTPQYADSCYIKGIAEFRNQNFKEAKMCFDLSWEINDSIQRNEPYLSSNASYWFAYLLYLEGEIEEAQDISVDYCLMPVDQRKTLVSDSLWVLASESPDLRQALSFSKTARSIEVNNLGHRHYYIANSDQHIADIYMQLNQWDSAKYYREEAIDIFEECFDSDYTQNYIKTLLGYIRTCVHLSDFDAYKKTINKCKVTAQRLFGLASINYAYTLYEISRANNYFDDFVDSISNIKEAISVYSLFLPSKEIEMRLVLCYQLLGNAYGYINNYQTAKDYLQKANDILEKDKSIADEILFDIAYYQGKCGEFGEAITTYKKLIHYLEDFYLLQDTDKEHSQELLVSSYLDLAEIFYHQEKIDSTFEYANKGLSLAQKYNIKSKQLDALQSISLCYFHQLQYDKAIELQEYILNENGETINMTNVYNLMWSYYATKNKDGFYKCANEYYSFAKSEILSVFSRIYEKNRLDYLKEGDFDRFSCPIRFARYFSNDDSICSLAYNCELFRKGILLTSSIEFSRIVTENDETIQNEYQQLMRIRERLNRPIQDRKRRELIEKEQQIEGELLKQTPMWADNIRQLQYSWKDVQSALKENEIAIEFAEDITDKKRKTMIALIIRSGWSAPKCVVLNEFNCNDISITNYNNSVFEDISLSNSIWGSIISESQLSDHDNVYFAADGIFRVFPIEHLCNPENPKQTISERFNLVRLSSTREICKHDNDSSLLSISLYGNLQYDISRETKIANSRKYNPSKYCADDNKRSPLMNDSIRSGYKYLYWTKAEIDSIEEYAITYMPQMSISKYELDMGSEESFKALSNKSTSIIHFATHAFYFDTISSGNASPSEGLLLAGCNTICNDSSTVEDGILCSSEIELLNLRNTSLVVLSGCNTGLGPTMVDGIGGLQRSFKKAGVKSIIMSLWEVSDIATAYFMQNFYKSLFITKSKRTAFIQAQRLTKNKFESPYYWASFILLD